MTDDWARPDGSTPAPVEVPLQGAGPLVEPAPDRPEAERPPNWRRVVGVAALIGVVGGIVLGVAVVAFGGDEDGDGIAGDVSTAPDSSLSTTEITTPPTLAPLDTLPSPDLDEDGDGDGPVATTSQDLSLFEPDTPVTAPTFEPVTGVPADVLDDFDLDLAVEQLGADVALQTATRVEFEGGGFDLDVSMLRDPVDDRYSVTISDGDLTDRIIVDLIGGSTYVTSSRAGEEDSWMGYDNRNLAAALEVTDLRELFDELLLGPVRPDTIGLSTVESRSLVSLGETGPLAREFVVEMSAGAAPRWQPYMFGQSGGIGPDAPGSRVSYSVYVTESDLVTRVVGASTVGPYTQVIDHRITVLDGTLTIDLPDPDEVEQVVLPEPTPVTIATVPPPATTPGTEPSG